MRDMEVDVAGVEAMAVVTKVLIQLTISEKPHTGSFLHLSPLWGSMIRGMENAEHLPSSSRSSPSITRMLCICIL
jgi:hypothetical protein